MKTNPLLPLALFALISCGTAPVEENKPAAKQWLRLADSLKTTEKEAIGTVVTSPEGIFEQFIPIPMYVEKWLVAPGAYVEKGQSIDRVRAGRRPLGAFHRKRVVCRSWQPF